MSPIKIVIVLLMLLIIIAVGLMLAILLSGNQAASNPVTRKINREVSKKAVEKYISEETGTSIDLDEVEASMTEEDADTFNDIVDKYADSGIVSDALSVYRANGGDLAATANELKDKINPEDMETIKELYEKYGSTYTLE